MSFRLKYRDMIQIFKKVSVSLMALALVTTTASASDRTTSNAAYSSKTSVKSVAKSSKTSSVNWNPVMDAIIQVESEGNPNAVSGNSVGAMQITPILVRDCNDILKRRKSSKRFTMADRYSVAKSKEMFLLIQSYYNRENSIEKAIRSWNGGVRYSVRATERYYQKVMRKMK